MKSTDYSYPSSRPSSRWPIPSGFDTADFGESSGRRTEGEDDISDGSEKIAEKKVIFSYIFAICK